MAIFCEGKQLKKRSYLLNLSTHLERKVWGGSRLAKLKGLGLNDLGETWEVSTLEEGSSLYRGEELGKIITPLSYLIKFLDTTENLSIQVHPGDEYANLHEQSSGKTECWVVIDAEKDAGIYLGLKRGVSRDKLEKAIEQKENIDELLNFYPVERGMFFYVPAGTIHAIGKNVFLAEVQQSSGVTYRVWDWNRIDSFGESRELHLEKALNVIEFSDEKNTLSHFRQRENVFGQNQLDILETPFFKLTSVVFDKEYRRKISPQKRPVSYLNLAKAVEVQYGEEKLHLEPYEVVLVATDVADELIIIGDESCEGLLVE